MLSPFEVTSDANDGYRATHTLAGTRLRTELNDLGAAISVVTSEFLKDTAATGSESLLVYTTGTEVGGVGGNYSGTQGGEESFRSSSRATRVRGLSSADMATDYFLTDIPWDSYNVDRIDIQRGPNSILFGFGSPSGIINATRIRPKQVNEREISFRADDQGSVRTSLDVNQVLIKDELSLRVAGLNDETNYRQKPAFENDRRLYTALKYDPRFLQTDAMQSSFNFAFERGRINSNLPRTITPRDYISSWFEPVRLADGSINPAGGLGQGTYSTQDNSRYQQPTLADGSANPDYVPGLSAFPRSYGNIHYYVDGNVGSATTGLLSEPEIATPGGLGANGQVDGTIGGLPNVAYLAPASQVEIAQRLGLPGSSLGQVGYNYITDPTIFDFWNKLLDGSNKSEVRDWKQYTASFSQSFFRNKLGYELSYDRQEYEQTVESRAFGSNYNAIFVDINSVLADGSPNPNVGRPFVSDSGRHQNSGDWIDREATRLTAYGDLDLANKVDNRWAKRFLGRHVLTGMLSREKTDTVSQEWANWATDDDWGAVTGAPGFEAYPRLFSPVVYIGPSLLGRSSAAGANLAGVTSTITIPDTVSTKYFDSTWNATGVDPSAGWDSAGDGTINSTQSENPANYVGWTSRDVRILQADQGYRDELTRDLKEAMDEIDSKALVLQSYFWDGAIVGTYGWRQDDADAYSALATRDAVTQKVDVSSLVLPDDPSNSVTARSSSWSVAVHANKLLGLDRLPFNVSLYYNESSNIQPAAGRIDIYGRSLAPPSGETTDRSILFSTPDNKYSFKVTKFKTSVTNATANGVASAWFLGQLQSRGDNEAATFGYNIAGTNVGVETKRNTYQPRGGQTAAEAVAEEAAAVAAWRDYQQAEFDLAQELTGDPNAFYTAWGSDPDVTPPTQVSVLRVPPGFSLTQDAVSEGYEFEFFAHPVKNWRITMNASENTAVRNNIGGEALLRHIQLAEHYLFDTPAGNLRIFGSEPWRETTKAQYLRIFAGDWQLVKLLEGSNTPELRKWRFNIVNNFDFTEGMLKGWNTGGAVRWQDSVVIGYPLITDSSGASQFDLDNPYYGPSERNIDLWIGYARKLPGNIHWNIQLNVGNAFAGKDLIPVSAQPDGSASIVRLAPTTTWMLTNTFKF